MQTRLKRTIGGVFTNSDMAAIRGAPLGQSSSSICITGLRGSLRTTQLGRTGVHVRVRRVGLRVTTTSSIGCTQRHRHVSSLQRFAGKVPIMTSKSALFCLFAGHNKCAPRRHTRVANTTVRRLKEHFGLHPSSISVSRSSVISSLVCNGGILLSLASRSTL